MPEIIDDYKELNEWLDHTYGRSPNNRPLFQVVFSDNCFEERFGEFNEFYGQIFLRSFRGVHKVPKYPWIHHRFVLERWLPPELTYTHEIPDTVNGSYEPAQVFEHENGAPVPVTRQIIEQIIWNLTHVPMAGDSRSRHTGQQQTEFDKEVEINRLHLEEAGSSLIKDGEAII